MLKYTLGTLAALAIIGVAAFAILARVTNGNAGTGPAPEIITLIYDDYLERVPFEVKRGQIISLRVDNRAALARTVLIGGDGVEQLPQLPQGHDSGAFAEPRPFVAFDISPGRSGSILVRFTRKGEYEMVVAKQGTFERLFSTQITVK